MKLPCVLASALLVLHLTGCGPSGPELGTVEGTLTIDGEPASGVRVTFMPEGEGRPSSGTTDGSGHYELAYSSSHMGALPGKHAVGITPPEPPVDGDVGGGAPLIEKSIPKEYLETKKQVEVTAGSNTIDLSYP